MTSASWNQETKAHLNEKITSNMMDLGSLARQVIRGSKSVELLAQAAKNFSSQETCINHSFETLEKLDHVRSQLEFQQTSIERSFTSLDEIQDQLKSIQNSL